MALQFSAQFGRNQKLAAVSLPSRIFLVGMPGSGKSTTGKYLSEELGYEFIDLDDRIVESEGTSIKSIFNSKGEDYFRDVEARELRKLDETKVVIATGGGTPCFHNGMTWMNENGFTLFLHTPKSELIKRTARAAHRPLIGAEVEKSINDLLGKRLKTYKKARMESDSIEPCEVLAELRNFFNPKKLS
jgi:shikimate kinase